VIGIVLAAGAGRRLGAETAALPKTLLPVAGERTILDIALRNLAAAGVTTVVIVVGHAAGAIAGRRPELERRHGVPIVLLPNDRALEWNNAYSLWLAREHFAAGALLVNGDTVHPASVQRALLRSAAGAGTGPAAEPPGRLLLAIDDAKALGAEEMKVQLDGDRRLTAISKQLDPSRADGEYMGVALIEAAVAAGLAMSLEATWRRDPGLYYEDAFAEFAARGGEVVGVPVGNVEWVEVDDPADLRRARRIAGRC
jgi:choline kinase